MKKSTLIICLTLLVSNLVRADFSLPKYEKLTLKNGLTVYLMEQHEVPLIDIQMVTKAGAINDVKSYGLATVTGDALSYGSGGLSKQEIEDLFAFQGAQFGSFVGAESSSTSLSISKNDTKKLLPVFRDILLNPSFDEAEFNKEKKRYIDQLKQSREQPRSIIGNVFNKMYYQDHPYGNPVSGDMTSIDKITLEQVKDFYKQYYVANNSALIVVGDFKTNHMKKLVKKLFSKWKSNETTITKMKQVTAPTQSNVWIVDKSDAIETTFMIGGKGVTANHPDTVAIQVINTILGARFTSWLNDELRVNSGLTYGARSRFQSQSQAGNFVISTFTKKASTFEAIDLALKTYQRLWNKGIDKKTLDSAKSYVKGQFPPRYETSGQLARLLATMWSQNLEDTYINDFQKNVDSLTVEKANKIAKANFPKDALQFVLIGKAEDIKEKAKEYGTVKEFDIKTFAF
jgi:predicted Zn-dependent peptidase